MLSHLYSHLCSLKLDVMKLFSFVLTYPIIWLLSRLPMPILYLLSDVLYLLLYYIIGYRKEVVHNNLRIAFPEKSETEIIRIQKKFFQHFTDLTIESVKAFSVSASFIKKHYTYTNTALIQRLEKEGRSIALTGSHQANWEWSFGMTSITNMGCVAAYKKLQNPYFGKVIKKSRTKFGFIGYQTNEFTKNILRRVQEKQQSLYILLSDQSPQVKKTKHWTTFLNTIVPVHTGAEILAKKHNFAVVNMSVTKIKRGYYNADFQLITETPAEFTDYEITEKYLELTEAHIRKQPAYYLWSHKRFKHKDRYPGKTTEK